MKNLFTFAIVFLLLGCNRATPLTTSPEIAASGVETSAQNAESTEKPPSDTNTYTWTMNCKAELVGDSAKEVKGTFVVEEPGLLAAMIRCYNMFKLRDGPLAEFPGSGGYGGPRLIIHEWKITSPENVTYEVIEGGHGVEAVSVSDEEGYYFTIETYQDDNSKLAATGKLAKIDL